MLAAHATLGDTPPSWCHVWQRLVCTQNYIHPVHACARRKRKAAGTGRQEPAGSGGFL